MGKGTRVIGKMTDESMLYACIKVSQTLNFMHLVYEKEERKRKKKKEERKNNKTLPIAYD
jgi:hypothetical protein